MDKNKGITLVALVITIILLLILAGVVINLALGEHGILQMAKNAAEEHKIAAMREKIELAIMDYKAKSMVTGEEVTVEGVLQELVEKKIFDSIDKKEQIGAIGEYDVKLGYDENGNVVIISVEKATGVRVTYKLEPKGYTNQPKVDIVFKVTGKVKSVTKPDGHVSYPQNSVIALDYEVTANGAYLFKVENEEGNVTDKEAIVDTIDMLSPLDFTITAEVSENGDVTIAHTASDAPAKENSVCSGIEKIEYYLQKEGETTYTKIGTLVDEENKTPYVGEDGIIYNLPSGTHKIYGVAIDKAGNESNQTEAVEIKVKKIVPPEVGETGTTHTAQPLKFDWEELEQIAKKISDNYGDGEGQINRNTAEVTVSINGKSQTIGIGDTTTVNGKTVRILGFNHDDLTNQDAEGNYQNAYGEGATNTKAGISFEFVDVIEKSSMGTTAIGGWKATQIRTRLNTTILGELENKEQIKQVTKKYIKIYNDASSVRDSNDYLWLLSYSEIFANGEKPGYYGRAVTKEGERYKYYINRGSYWSITSGSSIVVKGTSGWWLRSLSYNWSDCFGMISSDGKGAKDACSVTHGIAPGFAI